MAHLSSPVSLITFLFYYSSLLFLLFSYSPENTAAIFHKVEISSLSPASSCSRLASTGPNTFEVVHRNGPCSPHYDPNKNKLSLADILLHDQSRVNSIQAWPKQNLIENQYKDTKAIVPAHSGMALGTAEYVVTVGLGTPQQKKTLIIDTGSDITWTQCKPCIGHCHRQLERIYNPYSSSTYSNISCSSSECSKLGFDLYCYAGPCVYSIKYGDGSYSVGMVSKDRLAITQAADDMFPGFVFGCGQKIVGIFGETAGLLGLSKNTDNGMTFLNQTARKYGLYFSYCLPSTESSTGHLTFGCKRSSKLDVMFTPLIFDPYFYLVQIVSISVGETQLPIRLSSFQNPGTILDSGTVITRLPLDAYNAMKNEFKEQMKKHKEYHIAPAYSLLDTCYDFGHGTTINIPKISFTFKGGAKVDLDHVGILYHVHGRVGCLAFAGNRDPDNYVIFGNTQQKTFEVVYDVAGGKVGFARNIGCK